MKGTILGIAGTLLSAFAFGQENILLDRDFWKTGPSVARVEQAISNGGDPTELNANMFDAVTYALIEQADSETVKYLLGLKGNEVEKLTHDGRTYIFWAAYKNNLEIMQWLVDRGARADVEDAHGYSVVNFAAVAGQANPDLYDFLLGHGADVNATNRDGANALLLVSSLARDFEILDYFVARGLPLQSLDDHGNGVFQYASKGGNIPLLKELIAKGIAPGTLNTQGENALFMAARATRGTQNDKAVFEYLEGLGMQAGIVNSNSQNLLHLIAGRNEDLSLFAHLMGQGLDANLQDHQGVTPFMAAASQNRLEVVKLLGESVDNIDVTDEKGRTALALALAGNTPEVTGYLLDKGAEVQIADKRGNSMAYYLLKGYNAAKPEGFEAKAALLRNAGLNLTKSQHNGNTLLHLAAMDNNLSLMKRLRKFDIDINAKNDEGNTALLLAAMSTDDGQTLAYLVSEGADTSARTAFDESVYDLAAENELLRENQVPLDFLKM
jgi:ankyrin repeat protein